ncbi:hypothetical protein MPC1_5070002 [Methylocella tundrae]|nr:hypothetical protein MPC1_5070002 [Methylocella tundrae]
MSMMALTSKLERASRCSRASVIVVAAARSCSVRRGRLASGTFCFLSIQIFFLNIWTESASAVDGARPAQAGVPALVRGAAARERSDKALRRRPRGRIHAPLTRFFVGCASIAFSEAPEAMRRGGALSMEFPSS